MNISIIPMLKDNLGYYITCKETSRSIFIDISHSSSSINKFFQNINTNNINKKDDLIILTTHKHADHSGGNEEASNLFQREFGFPLSIYGEVRYDQTPGVTHPVNDGDVFEVGNLTVRVLHTPCHTRGSVCYHITTEGHPGALFTGDTLFVGGIGAFFEGNSDDMVSIFQRFVNVIPPETIIYGGHDYALNFLPNALSRDPNNIALANRLQWAQYHKEQGTPAMPTTFQDELETNLFLRVVSHTDEMAELYPQWDREERNLSKLMSLVYDTV